MSAADQSHASLGHAALQRGCYEVALRHLRLAQLQRPALAHVYAASVALAERRLASTAPGAAPPLPQVDVVVPVFNALADVQRCLAALQQHAAGVALRVLVVNDGSNAETTAWLRRYCQGPLWLLLEHASNRGYTPAMNTGLAASKAPFVVMLNSDTVVSAGWLQGLLACMQHSPTVGLVGPLSNAASWQTVPELRAGPAGFAVQELPAGVSVNDMAAWVAQAAVLAYPRVPVLNGFCLMVSRAVLDAVGLLDEQNFPVGYGEENDFCLRAQALGFELVVADDVYVFHAKSKSFGTQQRQVLAAQGQQALERKHGAERVAALVAQVRHHAELAQVRQRVQQAVALRCVAPAQRQGGLSVLFVLPVAGGSGGAHSVMQEAAAMRRMGKQVHVAVEQARLGAYRAMYADIEGVREVLVGFDALSLLPLAKQYDVVVATVWNSVDWLERVVHAHAHVLPAYYVQDYEPLFYAPGTPEHEAARRSYTQVPGALLFAKTRWLQEQVQAQHPGLVVHKVRPSLDHGVFCPQPRPAGAGIEVVAMVRPKTPRRGAQRTMRVLARLKHVLGDELSVHVFGADAQSPEFATLEQGFEFVNHGVLGRAQVAALLGRCDVFVDASDYQAFGRTALEAMACGCAVLVPKEGGCDEFSVHQHNALVVDTLDESACFDALLALFTDAAALYRMQMAALATAAGFSVQAAAVSECLLFEQAAQDWRGKVGGHGG